MIRQLLGGEDLVASGDGDWVIGYSFIRRLNPRVETRGYNISRTSGAWVYMQFFVGGLIGDSN